MRTNIIKLFSIFILLAIVFFFILPRFFGGVYYEKNRAKIEAEKNIRGMVADPLPPLDTALYDKKINGLANNPPPTTPPPAPLLNQGGEGGGNSIKEVKTIKPNLWPVKTVYPNAGAILPFKRVVAYYGNLYSTKMGVLGQYPEEAMLAKLGEEVKKWQAADPETPVVPALHYIAVVAQGNPGKDGKYRVRMPDSEIDKVLAMAEKIPARNASGIPASNASHSDAGWADAGGNALVFLDVQVGLSDVQTEIPLLRKYLSLPQVHLGIDPEFSMKTGIRPGKIVGTYDAADINFVAGYLAKIVRENNLPPKILVIHRYTQKMVTNYKEVKPLPEVEIVFNMDGWGVKEKKIGTYKSFISAEPVQFTGFKLFYQNDVKNPGTVLMEPADLLKLSPQPIYIQYQ